VHVTARVDYTLQAMVALAGSEAAPLPTNALADRLGLSARSVLNGAHPMAGPAFTLSVGGGGGI
jgi:DNA-binding IscR family transcriptional regulator